MMQKLNEEEDFHETEEKLTNPEAILEKYRQEQLQQQNQVNIPIQNNDNNDQQQYETLSQFDCHICFDTAKEPVITQCGHMFCWACIYQWLNQNQEFLQCPVCKNGISQDQLISVYTRQDQLGQSQAQRDPLIPSRPIAQRQQPQRNPNAIGEDGNFMNRGQNLQSGQMLAGYGFFPSVFNLLFQVDNKIDDSQEEHQSPEIDHQENFKRMYYISVMIFILTLLTIL